MYIIQFSCRRGFRIARYYGHLGVCQHGDDAGTPTWLIVIVQKPTQRPRLTTETPRLARDSWCLFTMLNWMFAMTETSPGPGGIGVAVGRHHYHSVALAWAQPRWRLVLQFSLRLSKVGNCSLMVGKIQWWSHPRGRDGRCRGPIRGLRIARFDARDTPRWVVVHD